MRKSYTIVLLLCLSLCFTTGCWDRMELSDRALVLGWAMDYLSEGTYEASAQIALPLEKGMTGEASTQSSGKDYYVMTATGSTVLDAAEQIQKKLSRQIFAGHRRAIFIGEELAQHGLQGVIDEYTRNPDVRLRTDMFVVEGARAKEELKMAFPYEHVPALAVVKMHTTLGGNAEATFRTFLMNLLDDGSSPTLPAITKQGYSAGRAIFGKDLKWIGYLTDRESIEAGWVSGNVHRQTLTTYMQEGNGKLSMSLVGMKSKIKPVLLHGKVTFQVLLTGRGDIKENESKLDFDQPEKFRLVKSACDRSVEAEVLRTIHKTQKEYHADIFGFGETIHQRYPIQWRTLKKQWSTVYSNSDVSVRADISVQRPGLTEEALQLKEGDIQQ